MCLIPVDGLTPTELRQILTRLLLRYESEPDVWVILTDTGYRRFQVQGEVSKPGFYQIDGPINLQLAIAMAGGLSPNADPYDVRILRWSQTGFTEEVVDLTIYYQKDSLRLAPEINDMDIIAVPTRNPNDAVHVMGAVNRPGVYWPRPGSNLWDVILIGGGFTNNAKRTRVLLISTNPESQTQETYNVKKIILQGYYQELPVIKPGDMIIVSERIEEYTLRFWANLLRDVALILSSIVIIDRSL